MSVYGIDRTYQELVNTISTESDENIQAIIGGLLGMGSNQYDSEGNYGVIADTNAGVLEEFLNTPGGEDTKNAICFTIHRFADRLLYDANKPSLINGSFQVAGRSNSGPHATLIMKGEGKEYVSFNYGRSQEFTADNVVDATKITNARSSNLRSGGSTYLIGLEPGELHAEYTPKTETTFGESIDPNGNESLKSNSRDLQGDMIYTEDSYTQPKTVEVPEEDRSNLTIRTQSEGNQNYDKTVTSLEYNQNNLAASLDIGNQRNGYTGQFDRSTDKAYRAKTGIRIKDNYLRAEGVYSNFNSEATTVNGNTSRQNMRTYAGKISDTQYFNISQGNIESKVFLNGGVEGYYVENAISEIREDDTRSYDGFSGSGRAQVGGGATVTYNTENIEVNAGAATYGTVEPGTEEKTDGNGLGGGQGDGYTQQAIHPTIGQISNANLGLRYKRDGQDFVTANFNRTSLNTKVLDKDITNVTAGINIPDRGVVGLNASAEYERIESRLQINHFDEMIEDSQELRLNAGVSKRHGNATFNIIFSHMLLQNFNAGTTDSNTSISAGLKFDF